MVEILLDALPDLLQAGFRHGRRGVDLGAPARFRDGEEPQGPLELRAGQLGLVDVFAVGLGDDHQVGHLHDTALDALQLVAGARDLQQHEEVDHRVDGRFGLPDADRLDEDDVETGGFAQHDRLTGLAGHASERSGRGRGPDEDVRVVADALHAGLVAEDRAAAALRRGVDGQHGQAVAQRGDHVPDGLDEGRLAGSGDSCDADADGFSGVGQTAFDDLLRLGVVGRIGGFDERDGLRKDGDLTGEDSLDIFVGR